MTHYLLQSQHLDRPENKLISTLFIQGFWSTQNLYNLLVWQWIEQSSSLGPKSCPCLSSGNHSPRLFQKTTRGFDSKINSKVLWAVLLHRFGRSDWHAQIQGVCQLVAVSAACYLHSCWKSAAPLAILTQFYSQKGFNACKFRVTVVTSLMSSGPASQCQVSCPCNAGLRILD